jgi:hypothetical protein
VTPFEPQDRVLVSPRYLAGVGIDRLADAFGPLIHLFGWPSEHDRASGHICVSSPDGSLFVTFNSRHTHGHWLSIAPRAVLKARFTRQTPIEAIAAVAQALPQLLGDDRHSFTADGCHGLASAFGRPRAPALTAARPTTSLSTKAARAATR